MRTISLKPGEKCTEVLSYFCAKDNAYVNLPMSKNLHKKMFNETAHIKKIGVWRKKN